MAQLIEMPFWGADSHEPMKPLFYGIKIPVGKGNFWWLSGSLKNIWSLCCSVCRKRSTTAWQHDCGSWMQCCQLVNIVCKYWWNFICVKLICRTICDGFSMSNNTVCSWSARGYCSISRNVCSVKQLRWWPVSIKLLTTTVPDHCYGCCLGQIPMMLFPALSHQHLEVKR